VVFDPPDRAEGGRLGDGACLPSGIATTTERTWMRRLAVEVPEQPAEPIVAAVPETVPRSIRRAAMLDSSWTFDRRWYAQSSAIACP
jgi:hypothetical protein